MKFGIFITIAISLLLGGVFLNHHEAELANEALADDIPLDPECTPSPMVAYSPNTIDITVEISPPERMGGSTCMISNVSVSNPVAPDYGSDQRVCLLNLPIIRFSKKMEYIALKGLFCTTYDSGAIAANGVNSDSTMMVMAQNGPASGGYSVAIQIDTTQVEQLWGDVAYGAPATGQIVAANLLDGDDADGTANGEIFFGGLDTVEANGGFFVAIDLNTGLGQIQPNMSETITWTLSATDSGI
ncbi:MAG: hypothetical protein ABIE74_06470 [Pseudomonadota bacterium]